MKRILTTVILTGLGLWVFFGVCNIGANASSSAPAASPPVAKLNQSNSTANQAETSTVSSPPQMANFQYATQTNLFLLKNGLFTLRINLRRFWDIPTNNLILSSNETLLRDLGAQFQEVGASSNFIVDLNSMIESSNSEFNIGVGGFIFPLPTNTDLADVSSNYSGTMFASILRQPDVTLNEVLNKDLKNPSKMSRARADSKRIRRLQKDINALGSELVDAGDIAILGPKLSGQQLASGEGYYGEYFSTNLASLPYQAFLSGGAEFLSPYQINSASDTITNTGSSTSEYLQFDFINRLILRDPEKVIGSEEDWKWGDSSPFGGRFVKPWKAWPDVQAQIGFVFNNNGSSSTNYSATTLAGSGDFYSEGGVGLPVWRQVSSTIQQQVTVEASGGFVTEKLFEQLHPNMFFGMGYEVAFAPHFGLASTNMSGFFIAKAGAGWVDTPDFIGSSELVATNSNTGEPKFNWTVSPSVQLYLAYPLTDNIFFTVEANAYFEGHPDSWNVKVGASIPFSSIGNAFGTFFK